MKTFIKIIFSSALLYLGYAFVCAVIIPAFPVSVSDKTRQEITATDFYSDTPSVDRVVLVEAPADGFDARIQIIREAEKTLDISYHCVESGSAAEYFFGAVMDAADRGVKVRFIIDDLVGGLNEHCPDIAAALVAHENIDYRMYNKIDLLRPWLLNSRLHDKYIIADDKLLMLGGRNIGDKYFNSFGFEGAVSNDRDVIIFNSAHGTNSAAASVLEQVRAYMDEIFNYKLTKPALKSLSAKEEKLAEETHLRLLKSYEELKTLRPELFLAKLDDWVDKTLPCNKITLVANPIHGNKKEPTVGYALAVLAENAKESVTVQTPYTVAKRPMLDVFEKVDAGVPRFELLTNSMASTPNLPAFSHYISKRNAIKQTGVDIFEYQGSDSIHAKAFQLDGRISAVGSLNLDERSLYLDTETMLIIDSEPFYKELETAMNELKAQSVCVTDESKSSVETAEVPFVKNALFRVASIFTRMVGHLI